MKAIVTGGTGFIGSHLARRLVRLNWDVHLLVRQTSSMQRISDLTGRLSTHVIDHGDHNLATIIASADVIFHLATNYGRDNQQPTNVVDANLRFPLGLLETAVAVETPLFIAANTCFPLDYPYLRPYTLSKRQFAAWGKDLTEASNTRFVDLKLQHPFGPQDGEGKFVPWIVQQCCNHVDAIPLTSGSQRKDFIFVADVVDALLVLCQQADLLKTGSQAIEVGSGCAVSIREFVEQVHHISGSRSRLQFGAIESRTGEPEESVACLNAIRSLGWQPSTSLEDGIRATIESLAAGAVQH